MKYTFLNKTNIEVSKICLGTMTFGEQNSEKEAHEIMDYAFNAGVNFFDTAELYPVPAREATYGKTEEIIGSWLKKSGKRDELVLASKIVGPSSNLKYVGHPLNFDAQTIESALKDSLKRLGTDYIDLYQLHWPDRQTNMFDQRGYVHKEEDDLWEDFYNIMEGMEDLRKQGLIRQWGVSNESAWGVMKYLYTLYQTEVLRPITIQNAYSLLNRDFEVGLAEVAMRENIGLLAYSPLAFGLLSGKYHLKTAKKEDRLNQFEQMSRYSSQSCWDATQMYLDIAKKYNISLTQMSLMYVNSRSFVTSNIIGATNLEQLKENIDSIEMTISDDMLSNIERVHKLIPNPAT